MNDDTSIPLYAPASDEAEPQGGIFSRGLQNSPGPSLWEPNNRADFGPQWDYELENHITKWVITPVSEAGLQWCYAHLPEHTPRYGARGFIVEAEYINQIVRHMTRDKLMSDREYDQAQEENQALMQGEEQ